MKQQRHPEYKRTEMVQVKFRMAPKEHELLKHFLAEDNISLQDFLNVAVVHYLGEKIMSDVKE